MNLLSHALVQTSIYAWDLQSFLTNAKTQVQIWGGGALFLLGTIAVAYSGYQIVTGLMSHGKKQISWPVVILTLIVGGAFMTGGFDFIKAIAGGGQTTIESLGKGTSTGTPAANVITSDTLYDQFVE